MNADEHIIPGHFGFDDALRLRISTESPLDLRLVIDHHDGSAHITLDAPEVRELRDVLTAWLERGRHAPIAAARHVSGRVDVQRQRRKTEGR